MRTLQTYRMDKSPNILESQVQFMLLLVQQSPQKHLNCSTVEADHWGREHDLGGGGVLH